MKSILSALAVLLAPVAAASESAVPFVETGDTVNAAVRWKLGRPADELSRGEWWRAFADPMLDDLVDQALVHNQDLRAAAARVEQARATAGIARSGYLPQLAVGGSVARERTSATTDIVFPDTRTTTYRTPFAVAWEIDLFGRIRNLTASARADAGASGALFEAFRLSLASDVALAYFSLRGLDLEQDVMQESVALRRRSRELMQSRFKLGTAAEFDVTRAETELAATEAETVAVAARRAAVQNALALLAGEAAPDFVVRESNGGLSGLPSAPEVPAEMPGDLLERRPDVAAAERTLAAANARIGVAKAAFFPAISLTGSAGYASGDVDRLFSTDSRIWSIGPALYLPIFQGGRNRANLERSRAAYEEAVAQYRQRVLIAFREVQDALTLARLLEQQMSAQSRALVSARRAAELAQTRYDAGLVSFVEVIEAQRTALNVERGSVQLATLRLHNSVALIKALGGGWHGPEFLAAR